MKGLQPMVRFLFCLFLMNTSFLCSAQAIFENTERKHGGIDLNQL